MAFLRRQYVGFRHLSPLWIGWRTDDGLGELGAEPLLLGRSGVPGVLDRMLFKQFGRLPVQPDLRLSHARVIHAHFGRGGALALPIARALGIPLVVTFHGGDATKEKHYLPRLVPTIYQRRLAALQEEASVIICVSSYIRDRLAERGFPTEKLRVVRYGIEIDETPPTAAMKSPYVLFVGRFVEKKGIWFLIEAMRLLERRGIQVPLMLIGDGSLAAGLREQARTLEHVHFLGWRPNSEVRQWMRDAVAVCVPSVTAASGDTEGLPNVVIEAMAQGAPVIGSHHSGIAEAVEHERTGLLVPSGDAAAIADAIGWLLDHPDAQRTMAKMARERARTHFDAVRQSRLLEDLLLSVCRGERRSSRNDGGPACSSR
ncbi:MAG TPA: glycosyltransferase [Stellaceae bacterium]|nr:glycosyltransferase [Stellaceae bacterium]